MDAGTTPIPPASRTRLVATCWAPTAAALVERVRVAADAMDALGPRGSAHLVEARFDLLEKPASSGVVADVVKASKQRLIATCRPGGPGSPSERDRLRLLRRAVEAGARGCDVELGVEPPEMPPGTLRIASHHAPGELRPDEAAEIAGRLGATGAAVAKLAAPATSAAAAFAWADAAAAVLPPSVGLAAVATGPAGAYLRQLAGAPRLAQGRPLSVIAYVRAGDPLPGPDLAQPLLADALGAYDIPSVGERTRLYGVIGWPLRRTWSPRLHDMLFRKRGLDARLAALPVRDRAECSLLESLRLDGVAATMPHKPLAAQIADIRSPRVERLGSANTLRRRGDAWEAEDFDGPAAAAALARVMTLKDASVVVVGAGGAAAAAALALVNEGARVTILARRPGQARDAATRTGAEGAGPIEPHVIRRADALVNATPAGSSEGPADDPFGGALPQAAVLDMVTTPPETSLLRAARAAGLGAVDGLVMLALQAAAQQEWWSLGLPDDPPPRPLAEVESLLRDVAEQESRA